MLDALRHRGPDGEGVAAGAGAVIGAVRLAVLDPERGAQPMWTADGRHCIALNGEIVNHVELRTELAARGARFRTRCDTEVLLEMLARDGVAALARADGMFALAFLDTQSGKLLLARDPCGIKPLYWTVRADRVLFASEPKALMAVAGATGAAGTGGAGGAGGGAARLDETALLDYLAFQLPLSDRTFFAGVHRLQPGTVLHLRRGADPEVRALPAWHAPPPMPPDVDGAAVVLASLLRESVTRHLRADVPLGAHLSGGVDSSLVAGFAARAIATPLHVFTGAFDVPGFDERPHARAVAAELGAAEHLVALGPQDIAAALPAAARAMDEPAAGPGLLPQWCVSRLAAGSVKVVLGGQGGDELFAGYVRHLLIGLAGRVRRGEIDAAGAVAAHAAPLRGYEPLLARFAAGGWSDAPADAYFRLLHRGDGLGAVLSGDLRAALERHPAGERFRAAFEGVNRAPRSDRTDVGDVVRFDRAFVLPALLHVEDRTSMAWSLESRVPLLGRPVLSFMERLPDSWLMAGGGLKGLLRRAIARDLPEAARTRRDKMGFPVPLAQWARGPLAAFLRDLLLDGTARSRGMLEPAAVERVLAGESVEARHLWALVNVELWMRNNAA